MSETKFTAGPLEIREDRDEYTTQYSIHEVGEPEPSDIAGVVRLADAYLYVAAPDLYAASGKALSSLRQYRHFFAQRGIDYPAGIDVEECVIAALAKARGEA